VLVSADAGVLADGAVEFPELDSEGTVLLLQPASIARTKRALRQMQSNFFMVFLLVFFVSMKSV
jgi:hypothetical protein